MKITDYIPHRPPMLLVDEVIEVDTKANRIIALKTVKPNEFYLQGHYPKHPVVPGVITCEMIFQTSAILMAKMLEDQKASLGDNVPLVTRCKNIRFKNLVLPNDEVELKVKLIASVGPAFYFKGQARVENKLVAALEFTCMLAPQTQDDDEIFAGSTTFTPKEAAGGASANQGGKNK